MIYTRRETNVQRLAVFFALPDEITNPPLVLIEKKMAELSAGVAG